jgi:hypothetical protein
MASDPLKRRGEAGMSIFLWSFPMDFWENATAPVAHLDWKLSFAPQAAVGMAPATATASVALRLHSGCTPTVGARVTSFRSLA